MHIRPFLPRDHYVVSKFTVDTMQRDPGAGLSFPHRAIYPEHVRRTMVWAVKLKNATPGTLSFVAETDPGDPGPNGEGVDERGGTVVGRLTVQRVGKGIVARRWREICPGNRLERALLQVEQEYVSFFGLNRAEGPDSKKWRDRLAKAGSEPLKAERFTEMWDVINLVVDQRYQRRGVGNLLMGWVLKQAKDEGVPMGLRSSETGRKLYEKMGFEVLEVIDVVEGERVQQAWMAWFPPCEKEMRK